MYTPRKIGLSVVEAGWLPQRPEGQIRGMLRRGELTYAIHGWKTDPASVRPLLDGAYARLLLDVVLGGQFEVPRPAYRGGPPAPLYPGTLGLALQTGSFVPEEIHAAMDELALTLGSELLGCADCSRRQRMQRSLEADFPFVITEFLSKIGR